MNMNYSEVLNPFHPSEKGDFMYRYLINDREYVVYSPEVGNISCLELTNFKDITPYQLAVLIERGSIEEELVEFEFEQVCPKDNLMMYLFGVSENDGSKVKRLNSEGYFLYELKTKNKVRNIYQFDSKGEYHLLFDNEICYSVIFDDFPSEVINVCWSPLVFAAFEKYSDFQKKPSYLLPSSNPILCSYIHKIADQNSSKINLCIDGNSMESLLFFSFHTCYKKLEKQISIFSDSKDITVGVTGWHPVALVRFISKLQKHCNKVLKEYYHEEQEILLYQLKAVEDTSFIIFPNNEIAREIFLMNIVDEIGSESISVCKISK